MYACFCAGEAYLRSLQLESILWNMRVSFCISLLRSHVRRLDGGALSLIYFGRGKTGTAGNVERNFTAFKAGPGPDSRGRAAVGFFHLTSGRVVSCTYTAGRQQESGRYLFLDTMEDGDSSCSGEIPLAAAPDEYRRDIPFSGIL